MADPDWDECYALFSTVDPHYSLGESEHRLIFDLIKDMEAPVIMELGVCHGRTAALLAYVAQCRGGEYHGIDTFELEGSADEFRATMERLGLPAMLHVGTTNGAAGRAPACPDWNDPLDVLFIDADHIAGSVELDCQQWIRHVRPGGLAILDDWSIEPPETNPHWGIDHYGNLYTAGWEALTQPCRLMVRRRPEGA